MVALVDEVDALTPYYARLLVQRAVTTWVCLLVLGAVLVANWAVGLALLAATPLVPLNARIVGMGTAAASEREQEAVRRLSARVLDRLVLLPTLVRLSAAERELGRLEDDSRELGRRTMVVLRTAFVGGAVLEALVTFGIALVATYVGLALLGYLDIPLVPTDLSLRTGLFVLLAVPAYFAPLRALSAAYHDKADAVVAAAALAELLTAAGSLDPEPLDPRAEGRSVVVGLRDVRVERPGRDGPVLDGVDLVALPGQVTAVTGPSGAGKSTLLAVAAGLLPPSTGVVRHGRVAPNPRLVAWVGQHPWIPGGTVRDIVTVARPTAGEREVLRALDVVGLGDAVAALPDGVETVIGDGGVGLSAGEIQRLALARAVLSGAPVVVLDEPTAHLDAATEAALLAQLRLAFAGRTVLLAAHGPAPLALADEVIALRDGRRVD